MKLIGMSDLGTEILDPRLESTVGRRVFDYSIKDEDYLLRHHISWEKVASDYCISVNGYKFHIPSGMYIFCGCVSGNTDWIMIDELINREVEVFLLSLDFDSWALHQPEFQAFEMNEVVYLPSTKSPLPVADMTGSRAIIISSTDVYHKMKDKDFSAMFVI